MNQILNDIQLIIPLSGLGSRYLNAGYDLPKPLIEVHGHPMIEWVVKMFPDQDNIIFICRDEHLQTTTLKNKLSCIAPNAKIVSIPGHKKGPVYAVSKVFSILNDDQPVIVSYCDYYMHWDYQEFIDDILTKGYDGAIPCYTHFHPHLIPKQNVYACCKVDNENNLLEIREKHSFTEDKTLSLHSPGVYYFKNGAITKTYFNMMLNEDISLNGEYYVSMVYNLMLRDNLRVHVPANIKYFCQWGTPEDLEEYLFWIEKIKGFQ